MPDSPLSTRLEALALRALMGEYARLNDSLFDAKLRRPSLELTESRVRLGQWCGQSRRLSLSRHLVTHHPWGAVVEVLKHEMAHQYVDEVLRVVGQSAHGPAFRGACQARGIDERASGAPTEGRAAEEAIRPVGALQKVARLLSLAESANQHEAHAAMHAAQRLMLKYNLEECGAPAEQRYCFRHLGTPTGRVFEAARVLALILTEHFFVETIWVPVWRAREGKRGSVIEVCGTWPNVEMAEYVHDFLLRSSERLWREHKQTHDIRKNRDRRSFQAGVMSGFRDKLASDRRARQREGLIWRGDAALGEYLNKRHPGSRWTHYRSTHDAAAHARGQQAGAKLVLHRGLRNSATVKKPRQLPPG